MVLLISKELDKSTNEVMYWLFNKGQKVERLNNEDLIDDIKVSINDFMEKSYINNIDFTKVEKVWIRKGQLPSIYGISDVEVNEYPILKEYVLHVIEDLPYTIGSILSELNHNKLIDFSLALKLGFNPHYALEY